MYTIDHALPRLVHQTLGGFATPTPDGMGSTERKSPPWWRGLVLEGQICLGRPGKNTWEASAQTTTNVLPRVLPPKVRTCLTGDTRHAVGSHSHQTAGRHFDFAFESASESDWPGQSSVICDQRYPFGNPRSAATWASPWGPVQGRRSRSPSRPVVCGWFVFFTTDRSVLSITAKV